MRIGPKMWQAVQFVARHPGTAILPVARYVAPCGVPGGTPGISYGYRTVHRAIAAGLIDATAGKGNAYSLRVAA